MTGRGCAPRDGFSLVEVIVALVVLTIGLLAMAATTGHVITRVRMSGLDTERAVATQQVVEWLRAQPFNAVQSRDGSTPLLVGGYRFWWEVPDPQPNFKKVVVISEGRGYTGWQWSDAARDTFSISIFRP